MGMRLLTTKFTSYNIAKAEKADKKALIDFIDVGNLSVHKMLRLVQIGNNLCDEEHAADKLDNFLADDEHSLVDAYIQLLDELDMDTKLLKRSGVKVSDIRAQFENNIQAVTNKNDEDEYTSTDERDYEHEFNPDLYSAR